MAILHPEGLIPEPLGWLLIMSCNPGTREEKSAEGIRYFVTAPFYHRLFGFAMKFVSLFFNFTLTNVCVICRPEKPLPFILDKWN